MQIPGIRPHLTVRDGAAALEFYQKAFGATLPDHPISRTPDGKVMHAMVVIDGSILMFNDEFPQYGAYGPAEGATLPFVLHRDVPDVDRAVASAVAAGATVSMPAADQFWGQRYARVTDPFGYLWSFGGPLRGEPPSEP